jgi:hypothetical protein
MHVLSISLAAIVACASAHADTARPATHYAERVGDAQQAFRAGRWAAAYGRFAALADRGDAPAAQVALLMATQGPALFGSHWSVSEGQRRRWQALSDAAARRSVADGGRDD